MCVLLLPNTKEIEIPRKSRRPSPGIYCLWLYNNNAWPFGIWQMQGTLETTSPSGQERESGHLITLKGEARMEGDAHSCMSTIKRPTNQAGPCLSLSPPPLLSNARLSPTQNSTERATRPLLLLYQPYPYHYPRPGRERKLTGKSRMVPSRWGHLGGWHTSHPVMDGERFRDLSSTLIYHKNITEMQEQDILFSST